MKAIARQFMRIMTDRNIRGYKELSECTGVDEAQVSLMLEGDSGVRFVDVATFALYFNLSLRAVPFD